MCSHYNVLRNYIYKSFKCYLKGDSSNDKIKKGNLFNYNINYSIFFIATSNIKKKYSFALSTEFYN